MVTTLKRPVKHRLVPDALRVETFAPQPEAAALEFVPPTASPNTWPPCCSERLVCV
jgi:hypothetical protein